MKEFEDFKYFVEQFEDIRVLKYKLPGFESLTLQQKTFIYYLSQAALSGRDILWDQNFRFNLQIRKTLEAILESYTGDKTSDEYRSFLVYAKRVFFANGIHHHYSNDKLRPGFTESYFAKLIKRIDKHRLPLKNGQTKDELISQLSPIIFDEELFGRKVEKREGADIIAESELQRKELKLLIDFYRSGDLKKWDDFNVLWAQDSEAEVDYNNGFIETYSDPLGRKATWEAIVNYKDIEATQRTKIITANAQWFEDNSPIQPQYRKEKVKGVAAKVINIAMLGGDCYPVSPLGINLPNANWIRKDVGSKSVTLANITDAYDITSQGNGFLEEFAADQSEVERIKKYGSLADALHTDLHECVGHASGRLAEGTDPNALKNYASPLEESRADLFALYYIIDKKIIELGLLPEEDAAKASYDAYLRNGFLTQIVKIKPGKDIEEAHMRNRSAISHWVFEKGRQGNIVELFKRGGKSYVRINDYYGLRQLFGELLKEIQRVKSEGDYEAGKRIIEKFGVKVDPHLHTEILERYEKLNLAPYTGFVNPNLLPVYNTKGEITDVKVEYVNDYLGQMLEYGKNYSFL
jgi:dipeptidyl-peptidase-3